VEDVRAHSTFRAQLDNLGVVVNERCGVAHFTRSAHRRDREWAAVARR
jgi:hypothetical protein